MVEAVRARREQNPRAVDDVFAQVGRLVSEARGYVETAQLARLGELMDDNHRLLQGFSLSTPAVDWLCTLARGAGAMGAKVTGAGGGGSVVALAPSAASSERILRAWRDGGFDGFSTRVGGSRPGDPRTSSVLPVEVTP
jgi:mevalonate kinase